MTSPALSCRGHRGNASRPLRTYGFDLILGLAAVGYIQAASTVMGPFRIIFWGWACSWCLRLSGVLRRSPRHLLLFCLAVSAGWHYWGSYGEWCSWWQCPGDLGT